MDMNLYINREEAKQVVQDAWRQLLTTKMGSYQYSVAIETVRLARGQAVDFGVDFDTVEAWEQEIERKINHVSNR